MHAIMRTLRSRDANFPKNGEAVSILLEEVLACGMGCGKPGSTS